MSLSTHFVKGGVKSPIRGVVAMLHITKVFQSGNFQAVRLPKDFRFTVDAVEVTREGDAVILRPKADAAGRTAPS